MRDAADRAQGKAALHGRLPRRAPSRAPGVEPVVRFRTRRTAAVVVNDLVHGPVDFQNPSSTI